MRWHCETFRDRKLIRPYKKNTSPYTNPYSRGRQTKRFRLYYLTFAIQEASETPWHYRRIHNVDAQELIFKLGSTYRKNALLLCYLGSVITPILSHCFTVNSSIACKFLRPQCFNRRLRTPTFGFLGGSFWRPPERHSPSLSITNEG